MSKFEELTDTELMEWYQIAIELRNGRYIKELKKEMDRRGANE